MTVDSFLTQYSGKKVFFQSFAGNGGDALLLVAAHVLFKKHGVQYQMAHEKLNLDNQIVFIRGGGNLVKYYNHTADFIKKRCTKVKELIILPHTITGHENALSAFDNRVTVFCREQVTYDYIKSFQNIKKVHLANDMAFDINMKESFPILSPLPRLIRATTFRRLVSNVIKGRLSIGVYLQKREGQVLHAFRTDIERTNIEYPKNNVDVSQVINYNPSMGNVKLAYKTSKSIFRVIHQFDDIHTNRLHIAIAAILLGKKVAFYRNGYHKNKSVYTFSMKHKYNNVTWMD